jgi:hypothetical protein
MMSNFVIDDSALTWIADRIFYRSTDSPAKAVPYVVR